MTTKFLTQVLRLPTAADTGSSAAPYEIHGPLDPSINDIGSLISVVLKFLIPFAALILLFVFIWGGYDFMLSQGSPEKIKTARSKIVAGIVGLVLMVFAFIIAKFVSYLFDINSGIL